MQHNPDLTCFENNDNIGARVVAHDLAMSVFARKQALDQTLEKHEAYAALAPRDKSFTRMLVSTMLRRAGQIDDLIVRSETSGGASRNEALMCVLRLGITQILFMDVPDHAAVDTSVRLADHLQMERQKGFVNGVLRHVTREGAAMTARQDAGRLNTPDWLLKQWIADYGLGPAAQIAAANLEQAPLDFSIKDINKAQYWSGVLGAHIMPLGSLRKGVSGNVSALPGYQDGAWWVQDAAAALPVKLMGNVAGETVLDLCAAPGGKTAQLAAAGAHVIALDRSGNRLKRLEANMQRLDLAQHVDIVIEDAYAWKSQQKFTHILLDAPCSATGTLRRHPDGFHLKQPQDVERLAALQARLLRHAYEMLAPGGVLVYCTCSLQKSERGRSSCSIFKRRNHRAACPCSGRRIGRRGRAYQ